MLDQRALLRIDVKLGPICNCVIHCILNLNRRKIDLDDWFTKII